MSHTKRILYVQPYLFFCFSPQICTEPFIRLSNYINSRKNELKAEIQEEYLDLRLEDIPDYFPKNIDSYRKILKKILNNIYIRFKFDVVAISCYTDFAYLNTLEIANMIKNFISPSIQIVVGGVHSAVFSDTFNVKNIPTYLNDCYQKNTTPIDYIIVDEGEKPFFNFLKSFIEKSLLKRSNMKENPIFLKREYLDLLDEIPPLNLKLFRKYRKQINSVGNFYTRFVRGCNFRCNYCLPSENYTESSKHVKYRSVEKSIEDLDAIINTEWLKIRQLHIVDPIFFPKRSQRIQFYNELEKLSNRIDFGFNVFDRIETCELEDLKNFKKYNIIPGLGLETTSKKMLFRIGKTLGKNKEQIQKGIDSYLEKTKNLIQYANKINTHIVFYFMENIPGTDTEALNERRNFFFEKNNGDSSLIEKYNIDLEFFMYLLFTGNKIYNKGEELFGAKYYYKHWWDIFDEDQYIHSGIVKPSENLKFIDSFYSTKQFVKDIFKAQMKRKNDFYTYQKYMFYKTEFDRFEKVWKKTKNQNKDV